MLIQSNKIEIRRSVLLLIKILVFSLVCFISACDKNKIKQSNKSIVEIFDKTYPPLNYRITGAIINGKRAGLWTTFDSLGKVETEETYLNGKSFGSLKIYSNGVLTAKTLDTIILNDTIANYEKYNFYGKVIVKGQYVNSRKRGIWTYYFNNGKDLKAKVKFLDKGIVFLFKSPEYSKDDY